MNVALRKPMTQDEFFAWAEAQPERYEFDGAQPLAMAGGSRTHARIGGNIFGELRERLQGTPYEPFGVDAGVQTVERAVRYPDCVVSCAPDGEHDRLIANPIIVFEVVSPSSVREDCILKANEYAAVPSIRRYVLVEQAVVGAAVLWRERDEPWRFLTLNGGAMLALPEIGIELPLDSFYERVHFDGSLSD